MSSLGAEAQERRQDHGGEGKPPHPGGDVCRDGFHGVLVCVCVYLVYT